MVDQVTALYRLVGGMLIRATQTDADILIGDYRSDGRGAHRWGGAELTEGPDGCDLILTIDGVEHSVHIYYRS